jgi:extradiol dioxygenase family protein
MTKRHIFHLSFPVFDLESSRRFYLDVMGAQVGRVNPEWMDILIWGHQITLHCLPNDVLTKDRLGKRHFGVVLPWKEWEQLAVEIKQRDGIFMKEPEVLLAGTHEEQGKYFMEDPSYNVIEIKSYRNFPATFNLE